MRFLWIVKWRTVFSEMARASGSLRQFLERDCGENIIYKEGFVKTARVVAPRKIEVLDAPEPKVEDFPDGSIVIQTHLTAICGTDSPAFVLPRPESAYPLNIGMSIHECIGTVAASRSSRFQEGDEVLGLPRGDEAFSLVRQVTLR